MRYSRIALGELDGGNPIASLAGALAAEIPDHGGGAIAIVDSPRCPIDVDSSDKNFAPRLDPPRGREIDLRLRALVAHLNRNPARHEKIKLSMFPTPRAKYFVECASDPACKPHLARLWSQMFRRRNSNKESRVTGGAVFTRFMIAGFAAHRALRTIGIDAFEGYPYLGFRLWMKRGESLPPKNAQSAGAETALGARKKILTRIARQFDGFTMAPPATPDQADAAILALTAIAATIEGHAAYQVDVPGEGRFLAALNRRDAQWMRDSKWILAPRNPHA